jgi:hypothetical protein
LILLRSSCCPVVVRWRLCSGAFCLCCGGGSVHWSFCRCPLWPSHAYPDVYYRTPPLAREGLSLSVPHYLSWTAPCIFAKRVTDEWMRLLHWHFRVF